MKNFLFRYATPLITGLFFVSLISGISLYVHVGQNYFRAMHEILSMFLIAPFVLHLWRNWRAWTSYFTKVPFIISTLICLSVAGSFAIASTAGAKSGAGGPPQFALVHKLMSNSPEKLAPLLGKTPEQVVQALKQAGIANASADQGLDAMAKAAGVDEFVVVGALNKP